MKAFRREVCPPRHIGIDGRPVTRTKYTHPYNYDPFILWQGEGEGNGSAYSDRLLQWDWDKHNELCRKHFGNEGQYWSGRAPEKIEAFLRDYFDEQDLRLVQIVEGCNQSSGYPYWCFIFYSPKAESDAAAALAKA